MNSEQLSKELEKLLN